MIDIDLDHFSAQVGGRFRLCTLIIKRARSILYAQGGHQSGTDVTLNAQVIRKAFKELEEGRLVLEDPVDATPKGEETS